MSTVTPRRPSSASLAPSAGPSRHAWQRSSAARRPSTISSAPGIMSPGSSTPSASGRGPGHRRRAAMAGGDKVSEGDWAAMEPDEVFRRLPVTEVKRVEAKMRSDALNKQSELRSMVGTRYRDLLTSASQITALHASSQRLSTGLKTVAAACANPSELAGDGASDVESNAEDVSTVLPVAAHVKLLLDAPEALYSYLAHHAYLNAAFLWLVSRVVKDSLSAMSEDAKGPYTQLAQKQWEVLLPFRSQIVQRATSALRTREHLEARSLSDTLLAIILLDSLPLEDALDALLSQRLFALKEILAHAPSASKTNERRRRSSSRVQAAAAMRAAVHKREDIAHVIVEAVQCLLDTERLARAVLEPRRRITGEESLLAEAIRLVQAGEETKLAQSTPIRRQSHQRRASRLASISLPLPPRFADGLTGPPVSAQRVLQTLPSSQILLRYLPASITGFTPFIAPSPAPALADKLSIWHASAIEVLREAVPDWLGSLQSVSDVWAVRDEIRKLLSGGGFAGLIREAFEDECGSRVQAIWTAKLDALVTSARSSLQNAAQLIRAGEETADNAPEPHMFTDVSYTTNFGTSFPTFLATLKKRAAFRTPQVDAVLEVHESAAKDIKADLNVPESLYTDYREKLSHALDALVHALRDVLADAGGHRDATGSVEAELFVGRIALYLANGSSFLSDLTVPGVDLESTKATLLDIHTASTVQWQTRAVDAAVDMLELTSSPRAEWQGAHPAQPSANLMRALTHLVGAIRQLGIPSGVTVPVVPDLIASFSRAIHHLKWEALQGDEAAQAAMDLGFVALLENKDDPAVQDLLKSLPSSFAQYANTLPSLAQEALRRTQLVLHPLTLHLPAAKRIERDRSSALLRLGTPVLRGGVGAEFKSPIAVAKPGRRFGLLSIVV